MTNFFNTRSWLDDIVLPALITIIRTCWIWPWLGLIQAGLSPSNPAAVLAIWLVFALPLISFTLARTVSARLAADHPPAAQRSALDQEPKLPLGPRLFVALLGFVAAILVVWWQAYRGDVGIFNLAWIAQMGDHLIHWPGPEIDIPAEVILIITVLALWLVGLLDAGQALTHDRVWRAFLIGVGMMALVLLRNTIGEPAWGQQLFTLVLIMLAAGMAALAFSSIKVTSGLDRALGFGLGRQGGSSGEPDMLQSNRVPAVNRYWFMSVGGIIGLLMFLGLLLTLLIAPEVLEAVLDGLWRVATFVGDIIANILLVIVYVVSLIFFYLYQLLAPLLRRLLPELNGEESQLELGQQPEEAATPAPLAENAPIPDEYRWLGLAIAGLITLLIFVLVIRRLSNAAAESLDEDRESILSADLLQDQLGSLWDRLMGRFRNQDPDDPFLPLDGEETRQRIRAVYQSLLATATDMGQPRRPALTPVEYEDRLLRPTSTPVVFDPIPSAKPSSPAQPESSALRNFYGEQFADQLDVITEGYVAARYGDVAPSGAVADRVERAWGEIEAGMGVGQDAAAT